jgi:hypothetical protein
MVVGTTSMPGEGVAGTASPGKLRRSAGAGRGHPGASARKPRPSRRGFTSWSAGKRRPITQCWAAVCRSARVHGAGRKAGSGRASAGRWCEQTRETVQQHRRLRLMNLGGPQPATERKLQVGQARLEDGRAKRDNRKLQVNQRPPAVFRRYHRSEAHPAATPMPWTRVGVKLRVSLRRVAVSCRCRFPLIVHASRLSQNQRRHAAGSSHKPQANAVCKQTRGGVISLPTTQNPAGKNHRVPLIFFTTFVPGSFLPWFPARPYMVSWENPDGPDECDEFRRK